MEERMNINSQPLKTTLRLILTVSTVLLAGCSSAPSNDEIKLAIAEKYSMSDVPKGLDCTLVNIDKTGQGNKRWNYACDATYEYGHRKVHISAWRQDGKLTASVNN
jgi:hypothetical protein